MKIRDEIKWLIPIVLVCFVVFANTVGGEFVYDDTRQIVRNALIQDNSLIWKALTSDVWAFKGDGTMAASNYWRPTFTLWNILCYRLFGMSPAGWHVANILLHTGVSVMAFLLLRKWQFTAMVAFATALIFAVHPVHVESVAWIAGSPDLLFSLALLGSLWFATSYRESRSTNHLILTVLLYVAALGAKEVGILCLPIYYFVLRDGESEKKLDNNSPLLILGGAAVVYFFARLGVIGALSRPPDDAVPFGNALMSVPTMFAFYLGQIFVPFRVAINYPITPVTAIDVMNFVVPLVISIAVLAGLFLLVRTSNKNRIAAAIFLLPLIPAMNATAFISEQIVHDRYLYLPLLGVLMLLVPLVTQYVNERNVMIACCVFAAALSVQTFRYNAAFANELSLWTWTSSIDDSTFTSIQLGNALADNGRNDEALTAFSAAIAKKPTMRGYLGRGRIYNSLGQYPDAEKDLLAALATPKEKQEAYAMYQVYESLGIAYVEQKKLDQAASIFREARNSLPIYKAALTEKLAIVYYQGNLKAEALKELEGAQTQARQELLPESKGIFLRLGMLYQEAGRKDEARNALNEYLRLTASITDKNTIGYRAQASKFLETLR